MIKFSLHKRQLEFISALYNLIWGLWILLPWDSFEATTIFKVMDKIAPEWAWGTGVTLIGITQMILLFTNRLKLRALASILAVFTLITMSILVGASNPLSTAMPTYLVIAIAAWLGYTEVLSDIKEGG